MTWRPHMPAISCQQASRNARERAIRFFAAAATWARIFDRNQDDESWESFEVYLDNAFVELEIAHYWAVRYDQCLPIK